MSIIFLATGLESEIEFYLNQAALLQKQSGLKVTFIGPRVRHRENPSFQSLHSFIELPIDPMVRLSIGVFLFDDL
jgi:hypothetical protein